jgi:hypothetical protein
MGTKRNPGKFDCHSNAMPDEPLFTLLARDPDFYRLVRKWAKRRARDVECGLRPVGDLQMVEEARRIASAGQRWRRVNEGLWRVLGRE